jgi:hypothetical protein
MPQKTGEGSQDRRANLAPHYISFERPAEISFSAARKTHEEPAA